MSTIKAPVYQIRTQSAHYDICLVQKTIITRATLDELDTSNDPTMVRLRNINVAWQYSYISPLVINMPFYICWENQPAYYWVSNIVRSIALLEVGSFKGFFEAPVPPAVEVIGPHYHNFWQSTPLPV